MHGGAEEPSGGGGDPLLAERVDDLTVYKRLLRLVEELEWLSKRCWSLAAATSLQVASIMIRKLASGLYRASIHRDDL